MTGATNDVPDIWPAWLWIGVGGLIYAGAPQLYHPLAAAVYFLAGAGLALVGLGTVTSRFNRMIGPMLNQLLPGDAPVGPLATRFLRGLVLGMEGLAVMHLSRIAVVALAPAP